MMKPANYILKLSCPDGPGIVHAVSGVLLAHQGNILSSAQHGDADHQRFFMRIAFESPADLQSLRAAFAPLAAERRPSTPARSTVRSGANFQVAVGSGTYLTRTTIFMRDDLP